MTKDIEVRQTWKCDSCGAFEEDKYVPDLGRTLAVSERPNKDWSDLTIYHNHVDTHGIQTNADLCPKCTQVIHKYKGDGFKPLLATTSLLFKIRPVLTVDALIISDGKVLLIKRKNPPEGWALPGGLMDVGETAEEAVVRELREETGLTAHKDDVELLTVRSDPSRDPRFHAVSLVYKICVFSGEAKAADDATELGWFDYDQLQVMPIAFDHHSIIAPFNFVLGRR